MSRRATDLLFAFLMGLALFALSMATPNIAGGDDAYRHVRFAHRLITDTQAALADPWHLEYLWPKPVDIWFGYHLLLAPLTLILPLVLAAKVVGTLVWTATVFALARFLDALGVAWRHAWVVLVVAGSGVVLYRAMLMRPFLLSLLLVILAIRYTLEEKPWHLALVSALHACSYSIFFLPAMPVGLYLLVRRSTRSLLLCAACGVGLAAGLVVNPFFPENAWFAWAAAYTRLGPDVARLLKVGGEVLPLSVWWLVASIPTLIVWVAAILVLAWRWRVKRPTAGEWVLLALSLFCLAVSSRAARMFDFYTPAAGLFAAVVLGPSVLQQRERWRFAFGALFLLAAASLIPSLQAVRSAPSVDRYRGAAEFLAKQPDAVVWNTQWQQYPFLYFWNWQSRYLTGMDPTLFYNLDQKRYWEWRKFADDDAANAPVQQLLQEFGVTHIVVDQRITPNLGAALEHAGSRKVFEEQNLLVFQAR